MEKQYDLIIIGSGPAGLAAAIYAQRAKLDTIIIEENFVSGGQVVTTYEVDNYPGLPGISGMDLGTTLRDHAEKMGAEFVRDKVLELKLDGEDKVVVAKKGEYHTKTVSVATGAKHRMQRRLSSLQRAQSTGCSMFRERRNSPVWAFPTVRPVTARFSGERRLQWSEAAMWRWKMRSSWREPVRKSM